jgi:CRISPR system Cascade subunit CasE
MSEHHYMTRARLRRNPAVLALKTLFEPKRAEDRVLAGHKLLWTLFADGAERERDFLWREEDSGQYLILSKRRPDDTIGLFDLDQPKEFAPSLMSGNRLEFVLRANATIARARGKGVRGTRSDVVMNAIHGLASTERAEARTTAVQAAGAQWLMSQGARNGFRVDAEALQVVTYHVMRMPKEGHTMSIGILDFRGVLEVTDPSSFTTTLLTGLGRAKAFGCGLMLVRRAR